NRRVSRVQSFILREEGFGYPDLRIDLLDVQIFCRPLGFLEIEGLVLTHRTAILDKNHVTRGPPRRDLLTLRLNVTRPCRRVGNNGADTNAEQFQQFAAAQLIYSFSHGFFSSSNLMNFNFPLMVNQKLRS